MERLSPTAWPPAERRTPLGRPVVPRWGRGVSLVALELCCKKKDFRMYVGKGYWIIHNSIRDFCTIYISTLAACYQVFAQLS